tara:strand:+ start:253 stop:405 length:153 start_codon:yes stop_codon:yes gene_type:complete
MKHVDGMNERLINDQLIHGICLLLNDEQKYHGYKKQIQMLDEHMLLEVQR